MYKTSHVFKKALSGQIGQSLMPIGFPEETPEQMEILEKLIAAGRAPWMKWDE